MAPATRSDPEVKRRFLMLVDWLAGTLPTGKSTGWQARISEMIGVKPPQLTKILHGPRPVGLELATRVAKRIGLDPRYFTDDNAQDFIIAWSLRSLDDEARTAVQLDLAGLRARGRELRRLLRSAGDHPRIVEEISRAARDVLESMPVQLAREVSAGTPAEKKAKAVALAAALLDRTDPFDRAAEDPEHAVMHLGGAVEDAVRAYVMKGGTDLEGLVAAAVSEAQAEKRLAERRELPT